MSILAKVSKQPREVKTYSIQFATDMSKTDDITSGYVSLSLLDSQEIDLFGPYTVTQADNNKLFYTGFSVTLPGTELDGFVIMVSNIDQDSAITVGAFNVAARCSIIVRRKDGQWVEEMSQVTVIVSTPRDKRIRSTFTGGVTGTTYKAQYIAETAEGETLEDEIILKIKEV